MILIVGAGPTGLTLANELARRNADFRIIDEADHVSQFTKALGVQSRTLELFEGLGVSAEMTRRGFHLTKARIFSEAKQIAAFDFSRIPSPYPYLLELSQDQLEDILASRLAEQGGTVEYSVRLLSLSQRDRQVDVRLRHAGERVEHARVDFVVGCDGARSTVRELLGVTFAGSTFDQSFAVADVRVEWDLRHDELYAFLDRGAFMAFFPMPDRMHRAAVAYPIGSEPHGDVTPAELRAALERTAPPGSRITEISWSSRFRINQRRVARQAFGRVFLAGDAAHIHSLIGAQGMNTGIQDAVNLAWKLAAVTHGSAPPDLLDTYQTERGEVSRRLLKTTGRITRLTLLASPLATAVRRTVAPLATARDSIQRRIPIAMSQTDLAYPHSAISGQGPGRPGPGDRAPDARTGHGRVYDLLRATGYVLLFFDGTDSEWYALREAIAHYHDVTAQRIVRGAGPDTAHRRYGMDNGGYVLIRPDNYLAVRADPNDIGPLSTYLRRWLTTGSAQNGIVSR